MARTTLAAPSSALSRILASTALMAAVGMLVAGCTMWSDDDEALDPVDDPGTSAEPTAEPTNDGPPALVPDGTAKENLAYFDSVNLELEKDYDGDGMPPGRSIIDNLVDAGFDKDAMEITADRTAIDLAADTIEFTVLIGDNCLFGQYGDFDYRSVVLPVLDTGKCLVGTTRTIDW